jgi:dipeptidase E
MKLLLTSGGITNASIAAALFELVGKNAEDTTLAFIPTASNVEKGDKWWLIQDLIDLKNLKFKSIDIVDISAIERSLWQSRLEGADVLFFEGGGAFHLMEWINKSGLAEILPELLKTRVYVGVSAGSMIACKDIILRIFQVLYEEDFDRFADMKGLGLVDFDILPHLNSPYFKKIREENIREVIGNMRNMPAIYVLDDNSALKIIDGKKVEVVSEGKWFVIGG